MKKFLYFAFLLLPALNPYTVVAQLTVTQGPTMNMTPLQLVQSQLVGQGVTVSNATYNGSTALISSDQIGYFMALGSAKTELGLKAGIIMTSGEASIAIGPNNSPGAGWSVPGGWIMSDPDLTSIAGDTTHDKCVLEFDFIPQADSLKFRYVFGSEEFYEFCYAYNDAFGFFLSGPGIAGSFSNNSVNIALMPGTSNFVTINNLCADPTSNWQNPTHAVDFQYDGLSYVFTATYIVTPCLTYHIKLAVADALDQILDSGVFLEKGSFTASGLQVHNTYTYPEIVPGAIEGCSDATVTFHISQPATQPYVVHYSIGGTATMGPDYTPIPDSVIIPTGQNSTSILIHPLMDNIPEGIETVILGVILSSCSELMLYDTIRIYDNTNLLVTASSDTTICSGNFITLTSNPTGGQVNYHYLWSTGDTLQNIGFTPPSGIHNYTVTVTDACNTTATDYVIDTVIQVPVVTNNPKLFTNCSGVNINIPLTSDVPGSTFSWTAISESPYISGYSGGSGTLINQTLVNTGPLPDTVIYFVAAINNGCTGPTGAIIVIVVPILTLSFQPSGQTICSGQTTAISILSSSPPATISWTFTPGSVNITGASNGSGATIAQTIFNSGITVDSVVYHAVATELGCSGSMYNVTVLVGPRPVITNTKHIDTLCNNTSTNIGLTSTIPGTNFTWTATGNNLTVSGYSNGSGTDIIQTLFNSGVVVDTVTYHVIPSFNVCNGNPVNFKELVYPVARVSINPVSEILCSGVQTAINISSDVAGATFTWTATASSSNVSGYGPGSGNKIQQTVATSGYTLDSVTYIVTPFFRKCAGISDTVFVTIKPQRPVTLIPCEDSKTSVNAKPFLLKGGIPFGGVYSGPGVNPATGVFSPATAGIGAKVIHYTYTNFFGCTSSQSKTITVSPTPVFSCGNLFTDIRDNKKYPTTLLGSQCWLSANLNYGSQIVAPGLQIDNCLTEKYCYRDVALNCIQNGGLYQWDEMMQYLSVAGSQGICPPGWHIPTETEWNTLFLQYINNGFAASPLKNTGFSGFNALPAGTRFENSEWYFNNFATLFWSSLTESSEKAWAHGMNSINPSVSFYPALKSNAFSVRCIKD